MFNTQHLSTDKHNCHSSAQACRESRADCYCSRSMSFSIRRYIFTSSANTFTVMPWLSSIPMSSFMYNKNIRGPIPLPWTTPDSNNATSDNEKSTLVWCVRMVKNFLTIGGQYHGYHNMGYLYANFSLPMPLCSRLRPDVRDRQTSDRRQTKASLNAPAY